MFWKFTPTWLCFLCLLCLHNTMLPNALNNWSLLTWFTTVRHTRLERNFKFVAVSKAPSFGLQWASKGVFRIHLTCMPIHQGSTKKLSTFFCSLHKDFRRNTNQLPTGLIPIAYVLSWTQLLEDYSFSLFLKVKAQISKILSIPPPQILGCYIMIAFTSSSDLGR